MGKRKLRNYYSVGRLVTRGGQWVFENDPDGYLFSCGKYRTKIKPEDLPEWFVAGYCYHQHGYFSAKGVKDIYYRPSRFTNHIFKDDFLFVSYNKPLVAKGDGSKRELSNYDEILRGWLIVKFIKAMDQYSEVDTTAVKKQINEKLAWYQENWDVHREVPEDLKAIFDDV